MMRDLGSSFQEAKIRNFDMKGSKYQREVLLGQYNNKIALSQKVLKDQDFLNLEKQINING